MQRVYVAWDAEDARRFVRHLESLGIKGRMIEDREYPERGELHDTEGAPEVWIGDASVLERALAIAAEFEVERRKQRLAPSGGEEPDGA
jgi:hypothetical protein